MDPPGCQFLHKIKLFFLSFIAEPSSAAVFAGRPGRRRHRSSGLESSTASMLMTSSMIAGTNGAIIEEWSTCVKSMGVSSRESWAYRLTDGTSSYWQSCGTQGKHWIRLEMNPDVLIHSLRVQVLLHSELSKNIMKKLKGLR